MSGLFWLASYPKSGNTWFRMLIAGLADDGDQPLDINDPGERIAIAGGRIAFEDVTLIESEMLTADEADLLRPSVYAAIARGYYANPLTLPWRNRHAAPVIMKVHDAYVRNAEGQSLLGAADGAILIVRDPRAVAPSFAHHLGRSIDHAITLMASEMAAFGETPGRPGLQIRQKLLSWHAHCASWLNQRDMPVHLVRYEDLRADTPGVLCAAMRFAGRPISQVEAERAAARADFGRLQAQERAQGFRETGGHVFFRRGEADSWRQEVTAGQAARIERNHGAMMDRLGYRSVNR
jgi:aryl sulfotransferase